MKWLRNIDDMAWHLFNMVVYDNIVACIAIIVESSHGHTVYTPGRSLPTCLFALL